MVDALKRASAKRITVVMPFWGYSRQDKKHRGREPISARLIADLFKTAGADRIMTVDLHTVADPGLLRRSSGPPVRAAGARRARQAHLPRPATRGRLAGLGPGAPGRALDGRPRWHLAGVRAQDPRSAPAERGRREPRRRRGRGTNVRGHRRHDRHWRARLPTRSRSCSGTGRRTSWSPRPTGSFPARRRRSWPNSGAREVIFTDTLPIPDAKRFPQMTVLPIAPLLAEAILQVFEDGSVTKLFDGDA